MEATEAAERLAVGDTDFEVDMGGGSDELARLSASLGKLSHFMRELTVSAEKVAAGDMHIELEAKSEKDKLSRAFLTVADVNARLEEELTRLAQHARDGNLTKRGRTDRFQGAYAEIVDGINAMLDEILAPIQEGNAIIARIAGGDFRTQATGNTRATTRSCTGTSRRRRGTCARRWPASARLRTPSRRRRRSSGPRATRWPARRTPPPRRPTS